MKKTMFVIALALFVSGCATKNDMQLAQQDIEELKSRLINAEKSISQVTVEAREITEKSSKEAIKNLETLRKGTADMQANLDTMRVDVQGMAGRVEDLVLAAKKPFEDITLLKEDTSKAVASMEQRLKKLEASLDESNTKIAAIAKALEPPPNPDNNYKLALDTLKGGEVGKSRDMFAAFIEQFPSHKLIPNAKYWIGESYYLEKNYEQAIVEFQNVIKEYPGKEKTTAAMLKQALSFRELGDVKSAKFLLKELIDKFPKSEEVPTAKESLHQLK